jgi:hypothetical protein
VKRSSAKMNAFDPAATIAGSDASLPRVRRRIVVQLWDRDGNPRLFD